VKASDLDLIYKASLPVGHIEALEAVFMAGYYNGKGVSITATTQIAGVVITLTAPSVTPVITHTELR